MMSMKQVVRSVLALAILILLFSWWVHRRGYLLPGSISIEVDSKIASHARTIPGFDNEPPRPLAVLTDGRGSTIPFVENELIFMSDDDVALAAFAKRSGGVVVRHVAPDRLKGKLPSLHLVRLDGAKVNKNRLAADLEALNPGKSGKLIVSSNAGQGLVALACREAASGQPVSVNFVMESTGYRDKNMNEGMPAATPPASPQIAGESFDRNPNNWSYFVRGGAQNIGVGDAWRALDQVGRLSNKVLVAVIDGGFLPNEDNPTDWTHHTNSIWAMDPNRKNENECTGGAVCDWHGTNVVGALMGVPNNNYGAAGPAGPVARAVTIRMSGDVFNYMGAWILAFQTGARVVNMSFGGSVPALLSWSVVPLNQYTAMLRRTDVLLVAAAGNDSADVDAEDCAPPFDWPCWERAWYVPCENDGVMCVGALAPKSVNKRPTSNYGGSEVDIFGPGSVWVGPDLQYQEVHSFEATSAASPFVAGVAALVWAANPQLSANQVERILVETANSSSDKLVRRYVNAYAAVLRALGGTPPDITIGVEAAPQFGQCRMLFNFSATVNDPDDGPPQVRWFSDIDKELGTGNSLTRQLSNGMHQVTATATDRIGLSTQSNQVAVQVNTAQASRPTVEILSFANHQAFAANEDVTFEAGGLDPNKALGGLVAGNVRWTSSKDGELGWGQRLIRQLSPGAHFITVNYTGICGGTADDQRLIQITAAVADTKPKMLITTPSANNLILRADTSGQACLHVAGFGFDKEDNDFATIEWWETNRKDLQWKVLSFDQDTTVCLKLAPDALPTAHEIRLRGKDRTGNADVSSPLMVTVLPGVR
jgi:serine protease